MCRVRRTQSTLDHHLARRRVATIAWIAILTLPLAACDRETDGARSRRGSGARARRAADASREGSPATAGKRATSRSRRKGPRCTFRDVHFRVEPDLVLEVERLVGELRPTGRAAASFDDPATFNVWISEARVALDMRSLAAMMNRHVFAGDDAPMRGLEIETDGPRLKISGKLHKGVPVPFTMLGEISATPEGEVKIVPVELHAAGLPVRGLLDFFGVELDDLIKERDTVGIRVEEDVMYLQPRAILPPPRLDGRIVAVEVVGDRLVQRFGGREQLAAVEPAAAGDGNYMAFEGSVLRFGRLTMSPTDLTLVDADPDDPFLFSLDDYVAHLTAGYSRTLADGSLVTVMPDHDQAGRTLDPGDPR